MAEAKFPAAWKEKKKKMKHLFDHDVLTSGHNPEQEAASSQSPGLIWAHVLAPNLKEAKIKCAPCPPEISPSSNF